MFRRHDLVVVDPRAWAAALDGLQPPEAAGLLADWARRGWPAIVRRRLGGETADLLPLGVQLPLSAGRRRVALLLPVAAVVARPVRPDVLAAAAHAPEGWRPSLARLAALPGLPAPARIFGSLMWQSLTGLPYLREQSDLDVTFPCAGDPRNLAAAIAPIDADGPPRIDGELLLPDGGACQWREVLDGRGADILVKTDRGAEMRPRTALGAA